MDLSFLVLADDTIVSGINTAGTVRVNMLANLEALLNIFANSVELISIICGIVLIVVGVHVARSVPAGATLEAIRARQKQDGWGKAGLGALLIKAGIFAPWAINWAVASCRDANLFL